MHAGPSTQQHRLPALPDDRTPEHHGHVPQAATLTIQAGSLENGVGELFASSMGGMNLHCVGVAGTIESSAKAPVRVGRFRFLLFPPGALTVLDSVLGCTPRSLDPNGAG